MKNTIQILSAVLIAFLVVSCGEDTIIENENFEKGTIQMEVTDAPIDNAKVKSCFVTVSEIKLDGKAVEGFQSTKIDLLAYQNGKTKTLGNFDLESKTYSQIDLVLDSEGPSTNEMGCYIEENDGTIHPLSESDVEVKLSKQVDVMTNQTSKVILDFDLRKCIKNEMSSNSDFALVSSNELKKSIRVTGESTSTIKGNCNTTLTGSDEVVVYVYKKGTFDMDEELNAKGDGNIIFYNAVTSAKTDSQGDFELHFLEEGDYELHFMSYETQADGSQKLEGDLVLNILTSLNILDINLTANSTTNVSVLATGINRI